MIGRLLRFLPSRSGRTLALYLSIPVIMIGGVGFASSINPEVGVPGLHYIWMFWLLSVLKYALFLGSELTVLGFWYLTCLSLVWAKGRSWEWSLLAAFGPFGLIALTMLADRTPGVAEPYDRWVAGLNRFLRVVYQIILFVLICVVADQIVELKRPLVVAWQSFVTGLPTDEILRQQDASSGMWAFGELLETLFLIVLFYLLWPIGFNAARRLPTWWAGSRA